MNQPPRVVRSVLSSIALIALALLVLPALQPAHAYVEIPYSLGRLVNESTNILVVQVTSVDKANRRIVYKKVQDIKGKHPTEEIKHQINAGFEPREPNTIMAWAEVGKIAVFFHNGGSSEMYIDRYWYQAYPGDWWSMSHGEPFLNRSYAGKPEKLGGIVQQLLAGQEVIVPCMVDGDKNALKAGTARMQRMRASLKQNDYNPQKDFVGWGGNEDFRKLAGMPGFAQLGQLPNLGAGGAGSAGIAPADFNGDGKMDVCLYGETRTVLLENGGNTLNEASLGYGGPSRGADWADYNGDGKPDLLLATPTGPRLFTNMGNGAFKDDSRGLPFESYYNCTAASFIDYDNDKRPDVLLANGFLGLRLYRNIPPDQPRKPTVPLLGKWRSVGPFTNSDGAGFDRAQPPEKELNFDATYQGRGGSQIKWQARDFLDGQVNNLALYAPEHNIKSVVYIHREIDSPGAVDLPISLGSDDGLMAWLNGEKLVSENASRACAPDQHLITLKLKPGKNQLLLKVVQGDGEWAYYFAPKGEVIAVPGLFEDVSQQVNLGPDGVAGKVKGDRLLVADFNADGRQDFLYSAGTGTLAINGEKGFVEAIGTGISYKAGGVAPLLVDFDGDKQIDLIVPQRDGCKVFRNQGNLKFNDVTAASGALIHIPGHPTSIAAIDPKKTGKPDLIVGCLKGHNRYLKNLGGGKFADAGDDVGFYTRVFNTRAVLAADLNNDGAPDVLLNNDGQDSAVLIAETPKAAAR